MSDQEGMDTSPHFSSVVSLVLHHDVYIMLASVSITRFSYVFVEVCFSPCWSSAIVSTQTTTNHETILKRSTQQWSTHWKYRDEGSFVVIFAPTPQLMQLQATPPSPKPETVIVMGLQCSQHAIAEHRRACHVDHGICNCTFCMEYYGIMITYDNNISAASQTDCAVSGRPAGRACWFGTLGQSSHRQCRWVCRSTKGSKGSTGIISWFAMIDWLHQYCHICSLFCTIVESSYLFTAQPCRWVIRGSWHRGKPLGLWERRDWERPERIWKA